MMERINIFRTYVRLVLRFSRFLVPYWKRAVVLFGLNGIGVFLGLVNPYLAKVVVDRAFAQRDIAVFLSLSVAGALVFFAQGAVENLRQYREKSLSLKVNFDLDRRLFRHIQGVPLAYFNNRFNAEHLYRFTTDSTQVTQVVTTVIPRIVFCCLRIVATALMVACLNWRIAVIAFCLIPFLWVSPYLFLRRLNVAWEAVIRSSENVFTYLNEFFSHFVLIRAFAKEAVSSRRYLSKRITNIRCQLRGWRMNLLSGFAGSLVSKLIMGLIGFYGGYQVITGTLSLGSLASIMAYLGQLVGVQSELSFLVQSSPQSVISCKRIAAVFDELTPAAKVLQDAVTRFPVTDIVFEDVSFGYRNAAYILKDLNFCVAGRRFVAIVGESGGGKTTILNLILRLYQPWSGRIVIGGCDIGTLDGGSLRDQIGVAFQRPFLFNDTVEANIRFGNERATRDELIAVARRTGVEDIVRGLPNGYQTIVGENACKISEGQKQKIAIARALVKNPKLLLLDEAMGAMDSAGEAIIIDALRKSEVTMVLVVSHRLSTVMACDTACFLKGPSTVDINTPGYFAENDPDFRRLFTSQMQRNS